MDISCKNADYKLNNSEYAAFQFLMENFDWNYSNGKERYNKFASDIKISFYGNRIAKLLAKKKKLEPGETPPDFAFTTTLGKRISLSDYKGKYLLLYWWGMCPAGSIDINPKLVKMYQKYHDKGLEVIGITGEDIRALRLQICPQSDEEKQKFKIFFNPLWDVVYAQDKSNKEITESYIFNVLPTVMLISPEGKNIYQGYNDYDALEKAFLNDLNKEI